MAKVLITGGAAFIGSHLADELIANGYEVRVIDCLDPQVHGDSGAWPDYLSRKVERSFGDISVPEQVNRALRGVDVVVPFVAAVGVGQSMYRIQHYVRTNALGTAVLLETLTQKRTSRLIVASSMSVYGEGLYETRAGEPQEFVSRLAARLEEGQWDPIDSSGEALVPVPTPEDKPVSFQSIYAQFKYDQEKMCLLVDEAYRIPTTALRFFNAYGPRQTLSNPCCIYGAHQFGAEDQGWVAHFLIQALQNQPVTILGDGKQVRDLLYVSDLVRACLAAEREQHVVAGRAFNMGGGVANAASVMEVLLEISTIMGHRLTLLTAPWRFADQRYYISDTSRCERATGWQPAVGVLQGLRALYTWLKENEVGIEPHFEARGEEQRHRLARAR